MELVLIAAMSENRVLGREGKLPWHQPADLAHFKRHTKGHPILMGRKTWETLPPSMRPLPHRRNIILTRDDTFTAEGAETARSLDEALVLVRTEPVVFVVGGGEIYRHALPKAHRIELTVIHTTVEGDAHFPELDQSTWRLTNSTDHPADERNEHAMTFQTWKRAHKSSPVADGGGGTAQP